MKNKTTESRKHDMYKKWLTAKNQKTKQDTKETQYYSDVRRGHTAYWDKFYYYPIITL